MTYNVNNCYPLELVDCNCAIVYKNEIVNKSMKQKTPSASDEFYSCPFFFYRTYPTLLLMGKFKDYSALLAWLS